MKICKNIQKSKPQCNMVSIFLLAKFIPSTVVAYLIPAQGAYGMAGGPEGYQGGQPPTGALCSQL